jgi:hypothetical protein
MTKANAQVSILHELLKDNKRETIKTKPFVRRGGRMSEKEWDDYIENILPNIKNKQQ